MRTNEMLRAPKTKKKVDSYPTRCSLSDDRESALAKEVVEIQHKGIRYSEAAEIASAFNDHSSTVFAGSSPLPQGDKFSCLIDLLPQLTDDECALISGPVTLEEVKAAISQLKTNKTPGLDNLSGEFYQTFSAILVPVLLEILTVADECMTFCRQTFI